MDRFSRISTSFSIQWEELIWNTFRIFRLETASRVICSTPKCCFICWVNSHCDLPAFPGMASHCFQNQWGLLLTAAFSFSCPWANQCFSHALSTYRYYIVMCIKQSPYFCRPILSYSFSKTRLELYFFLEAQQEYTTLFWCPSPLLGPHNTY